MTDLELLREYEPIVRFTAGEQFFPCAVDEYVKGCSLWLRDPAGRSRLVVARGALDLDRLAAHGGEPALSLRFVDAPLSALEYRQWRHRPQRVRFHAPGRLARVPPWSRLLDSAFDLSLLVRGRVPGGTAAAAEVKYRALLTRDDRPVYYARVVRAGGWTVLHYLFFYVMNDWRSTFHGANDHEADWEQVFVYLYQTDDGRREPRWVAFASHDYHGDDLRRRWDDPLLLKDGAHPVVFAAAGSHASYFERGEYVMGVEPGFLRPVKRLAAGLRRFWVERLRQGGLDAVDRTIDALINVPFIDYARGDGVAIGPGGDRDWTPFLVSDDVPWVDRYRGLWGLDTQDPFGGERAPAGPKYNRDESVRLSWFDPLGFAGMNKVLPPPEQPPALQRRRDQLAVEIEELDGRIAERRRAVQTLALDVDALRATERSSAVHEQAAAVLRAAEAELASLKARRNRMTRIGEALDRYSGSVHAGVPDPPDAHLRHVHAPDSTPAPHRALQVWAALSGGVVLLAVVVLVAVVPAHAVFWAVVFGLCFATVEAAAAGRLTDFLLSVAIVLAVITAFILAREFWRWLVVIMLGVGIVIMIHDNLRELAGDR
ncbi:MAG TPA: hypothetical protein VFQ38_18890 [Longimicrobiales bacterium]|nr:hypothetical protein [Longimicrobiales bacterium]